MTGRFVDVRNPRHVKKIIVAIAVCGIVALALVNYFGGGASGAAGADGGDVISRDGGVGADGASGDGSAAAPDGSTGADGAASAELISGGAGSAQSGQPSSAGAAGVSQAGVIFVDVAGAVKSPDVYELSVGSRVNEAIAAAGGLAKGADTTYINRAVVLNDGDRLYIPTKKEIESGAPLPASAGLVAGAPNAATGSAGGAGSGAGGATEPASGAGGSVGTADAGSMVNLNTADSATLQTLNGVGPATAQKIIDYRTQHGNFAKIEDIKKVSGIGDKTFEKLKPYIAV